MCVIPIRVRFRRMTCSNKSVRCLAMFIFSFAAGCLCYWYGSTPQFDLTLRTSVLEIPIDRKEHMPLSRNRSQLNIPTIVLTTTNAGFLDLTENMLESIKRTGANPNITVIAEDKKSYQALSERAKSQPGLSVLMTNSGVTASDKLMVNTAVYNQFVNKRPAYVLSFLEKGNQVLFVDVDTYWFGNPLKNVKWDFDIALHNEFVAPWYWFCDGFVYYRPTSKTKAFVREWTRLLNTTEKTTPDQKVMNKLIISKKIPGLQIGVLLASQFPDGDKYFQINGWRENNKNNEIVVHLSYIYGHDAKVTKLKEHGMWII